MVVKGILMSIEGNHGLILTSDGMFEKVPLPKENSVAIGEEVTIDKKGFRVPKSWLSIAAACLLLVGLVGIWSVGGTKSAVAAYVSFDINPSLEAKVNADLKVVALKPMDSDGKRLISAIHYTNKMPLSTLSKEVADALDKEGYFNNQPQMVVSTTFTNAVHSSNQQSLEDKIKQSVQPLTSQKDFASHHGSVQMLVSSNQNRQDAVKKGLTAGKYALYLRVKHVSPMLTLDQAKRMTVKELLAVQTQHSAHSEKEITQEPQANGPKSAEPFENKAIPKQAQNKPANQSNSKKNSIPPKESNPNPNHSKENQSLNQPKQTEPKGHVIMQPSSKSGVDANHKSTPTQKSDENESSGSDIHSARSTHSEPNTEGEKQPGQGVHFIQKKNKTESGSWGAVISKLTHSSNHNVEGDH